MTKRIASLSLDLDNKWSYLKTHGDAGWESFPSYLDVVVPRFLNFLAERDLKITVFVVGQDAALDKNHEVLASISAAGHEIGNHSFHHEPWLHLYSLEKINDELAMAEEHIERVTGDKPVGFRGPGFSLSADVRTVLKRRGYEYDCSTFPTFLGPLARLYYFFTAKLDAEQKKERKKLFGTMSEGFRPLKPYYWTMDEGRLLEIPVTTMPLFKVPIHVSYLLYLDQYSRTLAMTYWRMAISMCRLMRVAPSLLLHPLDFMGCDDDSDLAFFPAMKAESGRKVELVGQVIDLMTKHFEVGPMLDHARAEGRGSKDDARAEGQGLRDEGDVLPGETLPKTVRLSAESP
jgi:uncharacterized small protein (DUF1192 family)